jgi:hypothetical protein
VDEFPRKDKRRKAEHWQIKEEGKRGTSGN